MKIQSAIVADDIRKEDNGKHIIIGAYSSDILSAIFPVYVSVMLWLEFYADHDGENSLEFRILDDKGKVYSSLTANFGIADCSKMASLVLPRMEIEVPTGCVLRWQMREKGKRWKTIKSLPIDRQ